MAERDMTPFEIIKQLNAIQSEHKARRLWHRNYKWVPQAQREVFAGTQLINMYSNLRQKYGEELFREICLERRLNKNICNGLLLKTVDEVQDDAVEGVTSDECAPHKIKKHEGKTQATTVKSNDMDKTGLSKSECPINPYCFKGCKGCILGRKKVKKCH